MKGKFALSFGLALIIVGMLNFFLSTNEMILLGLAISSLVFSLINIFLKSDGSKFELLYILPFIFLLFFSCYSESLLKINFIKEIINSNVMSVITIVSFGLLFISEYKTNKKYLLLEKIRHLSINHANVQQVSLILNEVIEYRRQLVKKKTTFNYEDAQTFIERIEKICEENSKRINIESTLLKKEKDYYSLDDIDEVYIKENDILNLKESK